MMLVLRVLIGDQLRAAVPAHPDALMLPTFATDAALHVRGIGAVLEVVPAGCRQGGIQLLRPILVGLGQAPDLVGCEPEVAEDSTERPASIDSVEDLLPYRGGQPFLCVRPFANACNVSVRCATGGAAAAVVPPCRRAVRGLRSGTWVLCVTDRMELLERPWRLSEHSLADPGAQHEGRHATCGGCLAN